MFRGSGSSSARICSEDQDHSTPSNIHRIRIIILQDVHRIRIRNHRTLRNVHRIRIIVLQDMYIGPESKHFYTAFQVIMQVRFFLNSDSEINFS